ncbi:transposase [Tepidanaerobacter acetatoxydans]|uniref:transposase n=1 Tax=Tepidanaerobacter acetatoxydans TaxID=499229 RepID=UPI00235B67AA|nr:transposase [Tepidanaerobacter acetatoxydans]
MSFCRNISQQMSIDDPLYRLTNRESMILKNTWAEEFSNTIFPLINEERFSVLYSSNPASRPNNPVNVYIGLLMVKDIFAQTDEEAIHSLYFDLRYQYALHTTSFEEQPVSKNSLSNFRRLVYQYYEEHGIDLIQEEIESHAKEFTKILNIDGRTVRMDFLMVSSSCKKLSRLEIIYSCNKRLIKEIQKSSPQILPDSLKVYLEEGHRNETIYRSRDKDLDSKLRALTSDAIKLYHLCKDQSIKETEAFNILARMLKEQTDSTDSMVKLKPSKEEFILPSKVAEEKVFLPGN